MIAFTNTADLPVAIEPDFIESIEALPDVPPYFCAIRMSSGKEHLIKRSYTYVTGVLRKHSEDQAKSALGR